MTDFSVAISILKDREISGNSPEIYKEIQEAIAILETYALEAWLPTSKEPFVQSKLAIRAQKEPFFGVDRTINNSIRFESNTDSLYEYLLDEEEKTVIDAMRYQKESK